jgi:1-deoxy-D-xylulose-5-phosphate reductoisomerase
MIPPIFPRRIAVLGSSGSIGKNTLEVIAESEGRLEPILLSVHRRTDILAEQIRQMMLRNVAEKIQHHSPPKLPRWVAVTDETADRLPLEQLPKEIKIVFGHEALCELVRLPEVDVVLSAIVGSAGRTSTLAALEAGKTVALANKEALVMGGSLLTDLVKTHGGQLIPVDSEHSAVMQALRSWKMSEEGTKGCVSPPAGFGTMNESVERIILTASGGPFRTLPLADMKNVTVEDALAHPTWKMGKKITIDSATLMNKALEIIEARWFFDLPVSKIDTVIHPQSLVHSMVEFVDGSILAQISPPDMRLPIQLALGYPYRSPGPSTKLNWTKVQNLEFYPPDRERFPALTLGLEVAARGGTSGAVINAANEVAVAAFLNGKLSFQKIVPICRMVLEHHDFDPQPALSQLLTIDRWARTEAEKRVAAER